MRKGLIYLKNKIFFTSTVFLVYIGGEGGGVKLKNFAKLDVISTFVYSVISDCILLLVQDLEAACDSALSAMTKVN